MPAFCLHLPPQPTPRERARLKVLKGAFGDDDVALLTPENAHGDLAQGTPRAVLSVAETPARAQSLPDIPLWIFREGDPRCDGEDADLRHAIAAGRSRVAMTLQEKAKGGAPARILAFADAPRRPWDSLAALRDRLDAYLPQMIGDARARDFTPFSVESAPAEAKGAAGVNLRQRIKNVKFFIHLCFLHTALLFRKDKSRVIMLHNPAPDILDGILAAVGRVAPFVSYSRVMDDLAAGRDPGPGFALTFDDGYKENMALLDVLDRHACPAMFFLNSAPLDSLRGNWFMNQDKDYRAHKPYLKSLDYEGFVAAADEIGLTDPCPLRGRFGLTSEEVRTLLARGHEIGVHTHNHPFLTNLEGAEIRREVGDCLTVLRQVTGQPGLPAHLAYPDGDYDERVAQELEAMGVATAATLEHEPVTARTRPHMVPRICFDDVDYPGMALFKLSPIYRFLYDRRNRRAPAGA